MKATLMIDAGPDHGRTTVGKLVALGLCSALLPAAALADTLVLHSLPADIRDVIDRPATQADVVATHSIDEESDYYLMEDQVAPQIFEPSRMLVESLGPEGSPVFFDVTGIDDQDGDLPVNCVPASGSVFSLGTSKVRCSATDGAGNMALAAFEVEVIDSEPPLLRAPLLIEQASPNGGPVLVEFPIEVSDAVDTEVSLHCHPGSGSPFLVGETEVNCEAYDDAQNTSTASFTVVVSDASDSDGLAMGAPFR